MIIWRPKHEIQARSRVIRAAWTNMSYDWKADVRERKFNEQSGICLICKEPIQDSSGFCASLDHAISVKYYAVMDFPIEEAVAHANNERNLVVLHPRCNLAKSGQDLEEFLERLAAGEQVIGAPKTWTPEQIEQRKHRSRKFRRRMDREARRLARYLARQLALEEKVAKRKKKLTAKLCQKLRDNKLKRAELPRELWGTQRIWRRVKNKPFVFNKRF
jgi:5-methylcytosine-specific restriction endonuclease McrA